MLRKCRNRFPRHRGLAIPTCSTARAWRTCRDACPNRWPVVSFEVSGGDKVPGILGACATRNFAYLLRGPCIAFSHEAKCHFPSLYRSPETVVLINWWLFTRDKMYTICKECCTETNFTTVMKHAWSLWRGIIVSELNRKKIVDNRTVNQVCISDI